MAVNQISDIDIDIEQNEVCDGDFDSDQKMLKPLEFLKVILLCKWKAASD